MNSSVSIVVAVTSKYIYREWNKMKASNQKLDENYSKLISLWLNFLKIRLSTYTTEESLYLVKNKNKFISWSLKEKYNYLFYFYLNKNSLFYKLKLLYSFLSTFFVFGLFLFATGLLSMETLSYVISVKIPDIPLLITHMAALCAAIIAVLAHMKFEYTYSFSDTMSLYTKEEIRSEIDSIYAMSNLENSNKKISETPKEIFVDDLDISDFNNGNAPIPPGITEYISATSISFFEDIRSDLEKENIFHRRVFYLLVASFCFILLSTIGYAFVNQADVTVAALAGLTFGIGAFAYRLLQQVRNYTRANITLRTYIYEVNSHLNENQNILDPKKKRTEDQKAWASFRIGLNELYHLDNKNSINTKYENK